MAVVAEKRITDCIFPEKGVVSFVGGGGKTSLLFRFAEELHARGNRVIVSTSTHMFRPDHVPVLDDFDVEALHVLLDEGQIVCVGKPAANGKITLPDTDFALICGCCDYLLIEADGAKRMPLKIPASHEPVIPKCTGHVIAVMGLDACGRKAEESLFRYELAEEILSIGPKDRIVPAHFKILAESPRALRKNVLPGMKYSVILNKADTDELTRLGTDIMQSLDGKAVDSCAVSSVWKGRFYRESTSERRR
ncbi:MAG: putative selenium-dependent hydroxylase accessory protein YqeC [Clostridia bacterium]|nr:putative selenium-dependent hydroxylase accessory protein YqeC [Clostridia bacterium]